MIKKSPELIFWIFLKKKITLRMQKLQEKVRVKIRPQKKMPSTYDHVKKNDA